MDTFIVYTNLSLWRSYRGLTLGKAYKVDEHIFDFNKKNRVVLYVIKDDFGDRVHVNSAHFKTLDELRESKIANLID